MHPCMMELFGRFGGGNFNIHIWAGFGYSIYTGILTVYTLTSGVLTIKEHIQKAVFFCRLLKHFEAS